MTKLQERIDVQGLLNVATGPEESFGINMLMLDSSEIPPDMRFFSTTQFAYKDDLINGEVPRAYCDVFWGQKLKPSENILARWISAATKVYFVCGSYETDVAVWKAIADGSLKFIDNDTPTPNEDVLTGVDLSTANTMDDVFTLLTAAVAAIGAPNITGLDDGVFKLDARGRLIFEMLITGSTALTIQLTNDATGTDLAPLLDTDNGKIVPGYDEEEPTDALDIIRALVGGDRFYNFNIRGVTEDQAIALGTYFESEDKLLDIVASAANIKDPAITVDLFSKMKALDLFRSAGIYHEDTTKHPDAAANGRWLPEEAGSCDWSWNELSLITDSGLTKPIDVTARNAIEAKGGNWIEYIEDVATHLYPGNTFSGMEKRLMRGRDYFLWDVRNRVAVSALTNKVSTFDNKRLAQIEAAISGAATIMIDRDVFDDTEARPFTVTMPNADDIPQSQRDSNKLTVLECFRAYLKSAIRDYQLVGTMSL